MVGLVLVLTSFSQELTKAEKKVLVAKAKAFKKNPSLLNQLFIDQAAANDKLITSEKKLSNLKAQIDEMRSEIAVTERRNEMLEKQVASLEALSAPKKAQPKSQEVLKGVVFRVQIGGFKKRNLLEYNEEDNLIRVETNANGIQEISLGVFRNYKKAQVFKKHLREMGLKDAWIVPYKDGERVLLKDVLTETLSSSEDR